MLVRDRKKTKKTQEVIIKFLQNNKSGHLKENMAPEIMNINKHMNKLIKQLDEIKTIKIDIQKNIHKNRCKNEVSEGKIIIIEKWIKRARK